MGGGGNAFVDENNVLNLVERDIEKLVQNQHRR